MGAKEPEEKENKLQFYRAVVIPKTNIWSESDITHNTANYSTNNNLCVFLPFKKKKKKLCLKCFTCTKKHTP